MCRLNIETSGSFSPEDELTSKAIRLTKKVVMHYPCLQSQLFSLLLRNRKAKGKGNGKQKEQRKKLRQYFSFSCAKIGGSSCILIMTRSVGWVKGPVKVTGCFVVDTSRNDLESKLLCSSNGCLLSFLSFVVQLQQLVPGSFCPDIRLRHICSVRIAKSELHLVCNVCLQLLIRWLGCKQFLSLIKH